MKAIYTHNAQGTCNLRLRLFWLRCTTPFKIEVSHRRPVSSGTYMESPYCKGDLVLLVDLLKTSSTMCGSIACTGLKSPPLVADVSCCLASHQYLIQRKTWQLFIPFPPGTSLTSTSSIGEIHNFFSILQLTILYTVGEVTLITWYGPCQGLCHFIDKHLGAAVL